MQIEIHFLGLIIWMIIQLKISTNPFSKLIVTWRQLWELQIINFDKGIIDDSLWIGTFS